MVGPAIEVLAGAERLGRGGELHLERFGIGDVEALLEGVGPPFQRLARDRAGAQHVVALLVEEHAAAVPGHLVPGAGQLLEADARDPQHRIARDAVLLGLDAMLDEFLVGRERLVELQLLQHVAVVVPHPGRREVGQAHQLAVHHRDLLGEGREVGGVFLGARHVVERLDQALADEVGEGEGRGLRHVDLLAGGIHRRELGRMVVERGDRRIRPCTPQSASNCLEMRA